MSEKDWLCDSCGCRFGLTEVDKVETLTSLRRMCPICGSESIKWGDHGSFEDQNDDDE